MKCLFYSQIYPDNLQVIDEVVYAEYSAETQIEMPGIEEAELKEPVLDLGCGTKAHLVNYLAKAGFEVDTKKIFSQRS